MEIELVLPGDSTIGAVDALSDEMERSLSEEVPGLTLRGIPAGAPEGPTQEGRAA